MGIIADVDLHEGFVGPAYSRLKLFNPSLLHLYGVKGLGEIVTRNIKSCALIQ